MSTKDPYKYFRLEARELVDGMRGEILLLKGDNLLISMQRLLRFAHTLKGAARVVKRNKIADLSHAIEDELEAFRDGSIDIPQTQVKSLLDLLSKIDEDLLEISQPESNKEKDKELASEVKIPSSTRYDSVRLGIKDLEAISLGMSAISSELASLRDVTTQLRAMQDSFRSAPVIQRGFPHEQGGDETVSIASSFPGMLRRVGRKLEDAIDVAEQNLFEVHEMASKLTLIPARFLLEYLDRSVQELAISLGKQITCKTSGGERSLHATLYGAIEPALLHIIRNAADHGLEKAVERLEVGKPTEGIISISIDVKGDEAIFVVSDDGRGVNLDAIHAAATKKGKLPNHSESLTIEKAQELLMEGLSTAETVTTWSGRGIGLTVVRDILDQIKGTLKVTSEKGKGTTFEIRVPISVTSLVAMTLEWEETRVLLPLESVVGAIRINSNELVESSDGWRYSLEGKLTPFAYLGNLFGFPVKGMTETFNAVIFESGTERGILAVTKIGSTVEVTSRPLPDLNCAPDFIGSSALEINGNPISILEPRCLADHMSKPGNRPYTDKVNPPKPILIVDDSLTTRMLEQSILESAGYEVDLATSAEEAMNKVQMTPYSLCLVDVEMPGMDGFQFVSWIKSKDHLKTIPVILVTSRNAPEDRQRGAEVGATDYIVKSSFDQRSLLKTIERLIQ